jgi:hypothetical protein
MGHRQVTHISKYTKKNYCTVSCLNLNEILSGNIYIKTYHQELLHYKLFGFKWSMVPFHYHNYHYGTNEFKIGYFSFGH